MLLILSSLYTRLHDDKLDFHLDIRIVQHFIYIARHACFRKNTTTVITMSPSADSDNTQKLQSDWGKPRSTVDELAWGWGEPSSNTGRRSRAGMGRGRAKFGYPWRADPEDANSGSFK